VQLAILFVLGWVSAGAAPVSAMELLAQATLTFNLFDSATLNPVYWSLPVEWDFYVVLPLLALAFPRGERRPWGIVPVIAIAWLVRLGCVLVVQQWGLEGIPYARWVVQLPARLDQFVFGMLAAWLVLRTYDASSWRGPALAWAGVALLLVLMWTTAPLGDVVARLHVPRVYWHFSAVGIAFSLLLLGVVLGAGPVLQSAVESSVLGFLGRISYSLYLWHYPVLEALRALDAPIHIGNATITWWLLAPALIVAVSWASYHWIERPFLRAGTHPVSDPRCDTAAASSEPARS
jgi:peptidoglycan/LPS O-acetylase OafA/YrhL